MKIPTHDLKPVSAPNRQICALPVYPWVSVAVWATLLALFVKYAPSLSSATSTSDSMAAAYNYYSCGSDGKVRLDPEIYDHSGIWDPALVLSISIAFGRLTFAEVKLVDLIWDLSAGRVGQGLLGLYVYRVVRGTVMTAMEGPGVALPVFASISFHQCSLESLCLVIKHGFHTGRDRFLDRLHQRSGLVALFRATAVVLCIVYVLAFSTFISATTGYQARAEPYVQINTTGNLIPITEFQQPSFVVEDGHRIGLTDNYTVIGNGVGNIGPVLSNCKSYTTRSSAIFTDGLTRPDSDGCRSMLRKIENMGMNSDNLTYPSSYNISNPPYNSFWFSSGDEAPYYQSNITLNNKTWTLDFPPLTVLTQMTDGYYAEAWDPAEAVLTGWVVYENTTFDHRYILENGFCRSSERYVWGFAGQVVLAFGICTLVFLIMLTALQTDTYLNSRYTHAKWESGVYRDAVDIVGELEGLLGDGIKEMTERELREGIEEESGYIRLQVEDLPESRRETLESNRRRRKARHSGENDR